MNIPIQQAHGLFTSKLVDVYQERIRPKKALQSFFPSSGNPVSKLVSIEVERGFEKVAVDVIRGTEGNRNTFSIKQEQLFEPPIYGEYLNATDFDLYDRVLGAQNDINGDLFVQLLNSVTDHMMMLTDKIERAKEVMCASILDSGIITLKTGDNIDYKRKPTSKVDLTSAGYFDNDANDPYVAFENAAIFLRTVGKCGGGMFNCILGSSALNALLNNAKFKARQQFFQLKLDDVRPQQRDSIGFSLHGAITAGAYTFALWTYPQYYDDITTGVSTPYWNTKKVVVLPEAPRFKMSYGLVPQLVENPGTTPQQGEYLLTEFRDTWLAKHLFRTQSCPLPIPTAVDQIYTMQVLA